MKEALTVTTIDLLRHGHCEGGDIFRGSTDVSLTETGWQQMYNSLGSDDSWDHVISSSLMRCQQFSEKLSIQRTMPLSTFDEFREIHFGDWEGVEISFIEKTQKESLQSFWTDPLNNRPPNGEPIIDFHQRVTKCFSSVVDDHKGKHLLFVTHGAVIRVLMCELLNMPLTSMANIAVPYACLSRFKVFLSEGKNPWIQLCFHRAEL